MDAPKIQQYLPNLRKHYELAYLKIQQQLRSKWFRYVELFFIVVHFQLHSLVCLYD